jgi:signal transduction histidine kinase
MSLGLPFERWVQRLAGLAQEESDPQRFLALGVQHMLTMPWVRGVEWRTPQAHDDFGIKTAHATPLESGDLKLVIYTRWAVSPAILLHLKLLAQMVGHFYEAKLRAQIQRQNAYTHAIYETGARLTHDVKNLLQSLKALCAAAASTTPEQAQALQSLMQRQLPQITQRLNSTLEKLRSPAEEAETNDVDARTWWDNFVQRYNGRNIALEVEGDVAGARVPAEVFDSVADNLIENALNKTAHAGALHVRVTFSASGRGTLKVCDDGAAISRSLVQQLFAGPVASQTGLGVGLYQASRLAQESRYRLYLEENEPGRVCFALAPLGASSAQRHVA